GKVSANGVASRGRIITGSGEAGEFQLQEAAGFADSAISGTYAFALNGCEQIIRSFGAAGLLLADGAGNVALGSADAYHLVTFSSGVPVTGTYSMASGAVTGRGTANLSLGGIALAVTFYAVSSNKLLVIGTQQHNTAAVFVGEARKQVGQHLDNS